MALDNVRGLVAQATELTDETPPDAVARLLEELAVAVVALDGWCASGGALPPAWQRQAPAVEAVPSVDMPSPFGV